jgi:ribonuclease HI
MPYKFESELRGRADTFIEALAKAGIVAAIIPGSFRDYTVKVSIRRGGQGLGHVNLYYSPRKDSFSMKTHELKDKSIAPELDTCWQRLSLPNTARGPESGVRAGYQVYTDGSYLAGAIGFGLVVLLDGIPLAELSGPVEDETLQGMRQVGGELEAVYRAIEWCRARDVPEIEIFYDYAGIEKWATGGWKANKPATSAYAAFMGDCPISIRWHKVESHSGDYWNDRADQLAKQGAKRGAPEAGGHQDPIAEIREKAQAFVGRLEQEGVDASFRGIQNDQYGRIVILPDRGFVDVYNTRRRPLSDPRFHRFSDDSLRESITGLWRRFLAGGAEAGAPRKGVLDEVTYYYQILEPYRDCHLDFQALAQALERACRQLQRPWDEDDSIRYDFGQLESMYSALRKETGT